LINAAPRSKSVASICSSPSICMSWAVNIIHDITPQTNILFCHKCFIGKEKTKKANIGKYSL
jgi:hypothetical protein